MVATEAVQKSGLSGISFRTLADTVGIKSSSVHYYYPAKSDLSKCLIKNYTDHFRGRLSSISKKHKKLNKKLHALADIFESVLKEERFCLCGMLAAEEADLDHESRSLLVEFFELSESWLEEQIEAHKGELKLAMETQHLGKVCFSSLEGSILLDRVEKSNKRLKATRALFDAIC